MQAQRRYAPASIVRLRETAGYRTGHLRPGAVYERTRNFRLEPNMEHEPRILSVREHPEYARQAIEYISSRWREVPQALYDDCISESLYAVGPLPQWYLLLDSERIVGCAGLISNDFISRGDLWPWVCALYVEETFRGRGYADLLLERCRRDAERSGYRALYLSTELEGYYEKHGYDYIGEGYGPDGGAIPIYRFDIRASALLASGGYVVRPERPGEEEELCRLVRTAFETATVSDGTEQDFAARLRNSRDYIPELALVATCKERPSPHVMFHPDTGGTPRRPALRGAARRTALRTRRPPRHRPGRGTARRGHAACPRHGIRRSIPMRQSRLLPPLRLPFHSPLRYPAHRRHSAAIRNGRRAPSPGTARHNRHRLLLLTAPLHPIAAPAPIHSDTHHCEKAGPVHVSLRESPTTRDRPPSRDRPVLPPSRHNRCRSHHTPPRCRL